MNTRLLIGCLRRIAGRAVVSTSCILIGWVADSPGDLICRSHILEEAASAAVATLSHTCE
jgi:hypothetical protein